MIAFISGHRDITEEEFAEHYIPALDKAVNEAHDILVCDYYGADIMAQRYLHDKKYPHVVVVHMCEFPRQFVGDYACIGGFTSDEERDAYCTAHSDYDIAWSRRDGSGTWQNIERRKKK